MASFSRNKMYVLLISILLLSNLALVSFFVLNRPPKREMRKERPGSYMKDALKNDVGFNEQQMVRFEQMASEHRQQMRPLFDEITKSKKSFYQYLMRPATPDSVLEVAARDIGEKQRQIDLKIFTHFQNIRQLCEPAQQPAFDSLIQRVVQKMIFPTRRGEGKKDSAALKK